MSLFTINSIYRSNREATNSSNTNYTQVDNPLNILDNIIPNPENRNRSPYVHEVEIALNDIVNDISTIDAYNNTEIDDDINKNDEKVDKNDEICPICLEKIDLNSKNLYRIFVIHNCNHKYHYKCMVNWRKHQRRSVDFSKIKKIKCELCQTNRGYSLIKNYAKIKPSNRCIIM